MLVPESDVLEAAVLVSLPLPDICVEKIEEAKSERIPAVGAYRLLIKKQCCELIGVVLLLPGDREFVDIDCGMADLVQKNRDREVFYVVVEFTDSQRRRCVDPGELRFGFGFG